MMKLQIEKYEKMVEDIKGNGQSNGFGGNGYANRRDNGDRKEIQYL